MRCPTSMAYILQALITRGNWLSAAHLPATARIVPLPQGISLVPITDEFVDTKLPQVSLDNQVTTLPPALESWAVNLSRQGLVAYVEAEFFGGAGTQSSWL